MLGWILPIVIGIIVGVIDWKTSRNQPIKNKGNGLGVLSHLCDASDSFVGFVV